LQPQQHNFSLIGPPKQAANGASSPPQAAVDAALKAAQQVQHRWITSVPTLTQVSILMQLDAKTTLTLDPCVASSLLPGMQP